MAAETSTASDSLVDIPDNIAVSFLPDYANLSQKSVEKGLNYYMQSYIHGIKVSKDGKLVKVDAKCWRSMRKSEAPYQLHIEINPEISAVTDSYCRCKAGINGHCSHVVGLLKTLQGLKLHNFQKAPEQQSCTNIPQQWHVPRGEKIKPVPLNHVVVARPKESRKRKPVICSLDENYQIPVITPTEIEGLRAIQGTPLQYMLSVDAPQTNTPLGDVQIGSLLSYQTRNLKQRVPVDTSSGCGNLSVHRQAPVRLPPEFEQLNVSISLNQLQQIEVETRQQNTCNQWYQHRRNRLTASNFGKVLKRKAKPTESFIKDVLNQKSFTSQAMDYGRKQEKNAKAKYLETFPSRHIHECGFVINPCFTFLGASPDGKLCDNQKTGIIEIKCPFTARNMDTEEACKELPNFCLKKDGENIHLGRNHMYYAQVQGQLMVTGCDFCDFVVFTQKSIFVERITPDIPYMQNMLTQLCTFIRDNGICV